MTPRQVEVVPGEHLVAARSGALVVVGHRESASLGPASRAVQVWRELDELITEALDIDGRQFGRAFARLVARWVNEQDDDVEFGVFSPVETGLAVFLHGDVTAVFGQGETIRGRDAAFSVDRIVDGHGHAGLFVVSGSPPRLPKYAGIGSLVEGVLPGAGAVLWAEVAAAPDLAATRRSDVLDFAEPDPQPVKAELAAPELFHQFGDDPEPAPQRKPLPVGVGRGERPPAAAAPALPRVRGVRCARGHLNDPRVAFCRVCGLRMNETQIISEGERPPMGFLVLDDGMTFILHGNCVLGREPEASDAVRKGATPIRLTDRAGGLSRAHAEVVLIDWDVAVVDLGSTNGTHVRLPGHPEWRTLTPRQPYVLVPGAEISIGGRTITFDSPHAHL